jgi:squalene/phytoene synthase
MGIDPYENFPAASLLLPPHFRHPVARICRLAREANDLADECEAPDAHRLAPLKRFSEESRLIGMVRRLPSLKWHAWPRLLSRAV